MPNLKLIELENSFQELGLNSGQAGSAKILLACETFKNLDWKECKSRIKSRIAEVDKDNCKENLIELYKIIKGLISNFNKVSFCFFPCFRDRNSDAQYEKEVYINEQIDYFVTKVNEIKNPCVFDQIKSTLNYFKL